MSNMVVNTNILAFNSHRNLKKTGNNQAKASARLSSGMKINSAADDAAGLAISEKMRGQIRGLDMASKNSQDAISLVQTAEGGMQEVTNMVQRIRELTVQAANDTNEGQDKVKINNEIQELIKEIDAMAGRVEFNEKKLIDGTAKGLHFQVGANSTQSISLDIGSVKTDDLKGDIIPTGGGAAVSKKLNELVITAATTGEDISTMIQIADNALKVATDERAKLGATQNRLEYTINSLDISSENLSASESRIRDTDMAKEMMNLTKSNVLQQAATSMLAQANQAPQNVLQLLQ